MGTCVLPGRLLMAYREFQRWCHVIPIGQSDEHVSQLHRVGMNGGVYQVARIADKKKLLQQQQAKIYL